MVEKPYSWEDGAVLEDHSKRKHKILKEYFFQYLTVRCKIAQQEKFRLAVIDGFSGAGRYVCGSSGSPLIFIEVLRDAVDNINLNRAIQGLGPVEIECLLIFNDAEPEAINLLKNHCAPLLAEAKEKCPRLHLIPHFMVGTFESSYQDIKKIVEAG